jgi:predicted nucleic acid-binding protein
MSDKFFLDTNVIVYSFDQANPAKRDRAKALIARALESGDGVVSSQVLQEFLNVALKKWKPALSTPDAREFLTSVMIPLCEVYPGPAYYEGALEIKERSGFSFYDSLILQAAREARCRIVYSEDMQHGFKLFDLTIVNPFAESG